MWLSYNHARVCEFDTLRSVKSFNSQRVISPFATIKLLLQLSIMGNVNGSLFFGVFRFTVHLLVGEGVNLNCSGVSHATATAEEIRKRSRIS